MPWPRPALPVRLAAIGVALLAAGCSRQGVSDEARVVGTTLAALIDNSGESYCVDSRTRGEPLAIFRTMIVAPDPARRPLAWRPPTKVDHGDRLTGREIVNSQFSGIHPVLPEPGQEATALAPMEQFTLNQLARQLARDRSTRSISMSGAKTSEALRVRWWGFNRADASCRRLLTVSNPIVSNDTAFISVTSGHWGTTYALRRLGGNWRPVAQWADWLY